MPSACDRPIARLHSPGIGILGVAVQITLGGDHEPPRTRSPDEDDRPGPVVEGKRIQPVLRRHDVVEDPLVPGLAQMIRRARHQTEFSC